MKRIKSYKAFESLSGLKDVEEECDDILVAIRDERMNTTVVSKTSANYGMQTIEILIDPRQGEGSMIDLIGQAETLERLIYYLKSEGFRLAAGRYESAHSHDACPECGSEDIKCLGFDDDYIMASSECRDCGYHGESDSFSTSYWNISAQDELMSAIKRKIYMLELEFDRNI